MVKTEVGGPPVVSASSREAGARQRRHKKRRWWAPFTFVLPALLFLGVLSIAPLVMMAFFSVEQVDLGSLISGSTPFIGLHNYQQVTSDPAFGRGVGTSLLFTVACVVIQFTVGGSLALLFRERFPFSGVMRSLIMIGWVIPIVVSSTIFKWMLQQDTGILNAALLALHLVQRPVGWLIDPAVAPLAPIIANSWLGIPFDMALLLAGLQGISPVLYEAATVDGANALQRFWHLTLPLMRASSLIVLTLGVIYTLNVFDLIYILTGGGPAGATTVLPIYAYQQAFSSFNLGTGAAATMLLCLFLLVGAGGYLVLMRREGRGGTVS